MKCDWCEIEKCDGCRQSILSRAYYNPIKTLKPHRLKYCNACRVLITDDLKTTRHELICRLCYNKRQGIYFAKHYIEKTKYCIKCGVLLENSKLQYCQVCKKQQVKDLAKLYNVRHPDKYRENNRKNRHSVKGRARASRAKSRRKRNLGFIPLNSWYEGSHAHHINNKVVIYINGVLHKNIIHSQNNESMGLINYFAIEELFGHGIYLSF